MYGQNEAHFCLGESSLKQLNKTIVLMVITILVSLEHE